MILVNTYSTIHILNATIGRALVAVPRVVRVGGNLGSPSLYGNECNRGRLHTRLTCSRPPRSSSPEGLLSPPSIQYAHAHCPLPLPLQESSPTFFFFFLFSLFMPSAPLLFLFPSFLLLFFLSLFSFFSSLTSEIPPLFPLFFSHPPLLLPSSSPLFLLSSTTAQHPAAIFLFSPSPGGFMKDTPLTLR